MLKARAESSAPPEAKRPTAALHRGDLQSIGPATQAPAEQGTLSLEQRTPDSFPNSPACPTTERPTEAGSTTDTSLLGPRFLCAWAGPTTPESLLYKRATDGSVDGPAPGWCPNIRCVSAQAAAKSWPLSPHVTQKQVSNRPPCPPQLLCQRVCLGSGSLNPCRDPGTTSVYLTMGIERSRSPALPCPFLASSQGHPLTPTWPLVK